VSIGWKGQPEINQATEVARRWRQTRQGKLTPSTQTQAILPEGHPSVDIEHDFTTPGTPGKIGCPFAKMLQEKKKADSVHLSTREGQRPERLPTPSSLRSEIRKDPIAAEFHAEVVQSPPASVDGSAAKCPIRFLDQHSPEEVAKYFENHKHEIPRSHEVCVSRYQSNEESIRQLDAKYGNLVNMIQGLGLKHKPMLPTGEKAPGNDTTSDAGMDQKDLQKIQAWAENCSDPADQPDDATAEDGGRIPHFEKDLKEVRLGESPTRPWGCQVPERRASVTSIASERSIMSTSKVRAPSTRDDGLLRARSEANGSKSSIVFNGPVFIGYSAEDAAIMFERLQLGKQPAYRM